MNLFENNFPTMAITIPRLKSSPLTRLLLAVLAAAGLAGTALAAEPWWNDEWTVRRKVIIDLGTTGVPVSDPVGSSAVLLRLSGDDFPTTAKEDGTDLRFVAQDGKTALPFHIEKFDQVFGEAAVWVKVPDIKPGAKTEFWFYYGNAGPTAVKADDPKATFDSDTALVYHFVEKGAAAADASGNGNSAASPGMTTESAMIASGIRLGPKSAVTIPPTASLVWNAGGSLTWSAWISPSVLAPNAVIFRRAEGANSFVIGSDNGVPFVEVKSAAGTQRSPAGAPVAAGKWHHLAVAASGAQMTVYLDGESYATLAASLPALNSPATIGVDPSAPGAAGLVSFVGDLDELNIARVARPAGFIRLAALGQGGEQGSKLLAIGPEEAPTNWLSWLKSGHFGVIIMNLTFDGWVVIVLLAVMAGISWFVMVTKVRYLNGMSKGNALFMKEWRHVAADLTALDDADSEKVKTLGGRVDQAAQKAMRESAVYRIYHIGVEEIRHRLANTESDGSKRGLPGRAIQAIRASLDGGMVRETQKINRLVVLLTICISGGPFLGLLGTVIGVMITFAAVAAAGEVNVNAIAPGIAAALLATVAGLAVAIPALFGYNYILSRVKDATADMHVFIDEFVTRMAEFYKERGD
jgi:biopolymer transport protein ExbB